MIKKIEITYPYSLEEIIKIILEFSLSISNPVIVITGATGSGKTVLANNIAIQIHSRLISADSRQIYRDINIGSSKSKIEDQNILDGFYTSYIKDNNIYLPYWHIDEVNLNENYSVQIFRQQTRQMVITLHSQKVLPIIVGGSTHWIRSFLSEDVSPYYESKVDVFKNLNDKSLEDLQQLYLKQYKVNNLNISDWNNNRRLIRAIEYFEITNNSIYKSTRKINDENNYLIFQTIIDRKSHREKIKQSIEERINRGWIEEVASIMQRYSDIKLLDKLGQGYRIIGNYLDNGKNISKDELIELINIAEMRYAKKQIL